MNSLKLSSTRKSASQAALGRMKLTFHATRRTPHGASRLVQGMSAWLVKTRRAPSQHVGMRGSTVIRLRPCMNIEYAHPPLPPFSYRPYGTSLVFLRWQNLSGLFFVACTSSNTSVSGWRVGGLNRSKKMRMLLYDKTSLFRTERKKMCV